MVRGLYTAYTGMMNQQARLDVITNNLANASTVGYKKEGSTSQAFDSMYTQKIKDGSEGYINRRIGKESLGVKIGETYTDYTQGSFKVTGNTLDLALEGTGFFNIEYASKSGNTSTKYTRDGSFSINNEGMLVTEDGDYLLGENGRIQIPSGAEVVVDDEVALVGPMSSWSIRLSFLISRTTIISRSLARISIQPLTVRQRRPETERCGRAILKCLT